MCLKSRLVHPIGYLFLPFRVSQVSPASPQFKVESVTHHPYCSNASLKCHRPVAPIRNLGALPLLPYSTHQRVLWVICVHSLSLRPAHTTPSPGPPLRQQLTHRSPGFSLPPLLQIHSVQSHSDLASYTQSPGPSCHLLLSTKRQPGDARCGRQETDLVKRSRSCHQSSMAPLSPSGNAEILTPANKTFRDLGPYDLRDFSYHHSPLIIPFQWP